MYQCPFHNVFLQTSKQGYFLYLPYARYPSKPQFQKLLMQANLHLSTQGIKPIYLVSPPPTRHRTLFV